MLGTTICSTMWPSRSGGIPTPISEPSKVTRHRILLLLLPCNPYEVAPPLTMTSDNKGVNTFLGAQQQTLIKLSFMRFREGSFSETQRDRGRKRRTRRHQLTSVAPLAARIRKRLAFHRHELPIIAARVEGELQDAVGVIVVDLSVLNRTLNLT